jgi:hypothetical protein
MMSAGSLAAAVSFLLAAVSPGPISFVLSLILLQSVASTVLYATAFTAIVQAGGPTAKSSIVHLTLIAGFASTIFWPMTSWLHGFMTWREVFVLFAAINLIICFPLHLALSRITPPVIAGNRDTSIADDRMPTANMVLFTLMLTGFAIEGCALAAVISQLVPLTQALGLGGAGLVVASLFGPAQVGSRLVNLFFGRDLAQAWLAVIATVLLPVGLVILLATTPWFPGAVLFALCMGLGSGLTSIVGGTLPLELFGSRGYGKLIGWSTLAKQLPAAAAPFAMSASVTSIGVVPSLWVVVATSLVGLVALAAIPVMIRLSKAAKITSYSPMS